MDLDDVVRVKVGGSQGRITKVLPDDMFLVLLLGESSSFAFPKDALELVRRDPLGLVLEGMQGLPSYEERAKVWMGYGIVEAAEEVQSKASDLVSGLQTLEKDVDDLKKMKDEVTEALRECLSHYCPTCGFGDEGCGVIHHISCPMFLLLERAEGRKLKLNQEPVDEEK